MFALLSVTLSVVFSTIPPPTLYPVDEYHFDAVVDHFSFVPTTPATFSLRYYVNEASYTRGSTAPVLFYTGNEADIIEFVNNTGWMFELAKEMKALVVFAEHRYYGLSNPMGNGPGNPSLGKGRNVSYLTVEQAMEDFNTLSIALRGKFGIPPRAAIIAFGGSYGGNLALWLRLKNPNLWAGAIASSATPLKHLLVETNGFAKIETEAYGNVSAQCPTLIRDGWSELYNATTLASKAGRAAIAKELGLCAPLPDAGAAGSIGGWVEGALETMVQYGYPYPTSFYNPVPGYPFKVACEGMLAAGTGLGALRAAAEVYYNYSGQAGACFNQDDVAIAAEAHWTRLGQRHRLQAHSSHTMHTLGGETQAGWGYQCCTEVYQPMPTNGVSDFLRPSEVNRTAYFANCKARWNVAPRPHWEEMTFQSSNIGAGSNIFLTMGQLDPWRAAGIQTLPKGAHPSIIARVIEHGAHHYDLRASNPLDPPSVVAVRKEEKAAMATWIKEWATNHAEEEL